MKKCPFHVYWGKNSGVIITRDSEDSNKPEVVLANNRISLRQIKAIAAVAFLGLLLVWRVSRMVNKCRRRHAVRRHTEE